jgi:hypothetical protein
MRPRWPLPRPRTGEGGVHENPLALWPPRRWARFDLLSFVMGALATLTFATGLVYLNTDGLFSRTQSFAWLYNHGGPEFLGLLPDDPGRRRAGLHLPGVGQVRA